MSDPYLETIQEQWPNILRLYEAFKKHNPVMLYDIQENKVYAYPYKEFRAELSIRSKASLKEASPTGIHGYSRQWTERC